MTTNPPSGEDVEYTYSTPGTDQKAFSSGETSWRSTSTVLRAGSRDEDVDHRHLDLRLFLAGRHQDRERPEAEGEEHHERRQLGLDERTGEAARSAERSALGGRHQRTLVPASRSAGGSRTTRSPAASPERTSTFPLERAGPVRT